MDWDTVLLRVFAVIVLIALVGIVLFLATGVIELAAMAAEYGVMYAGISIILFALAAFLSVGGTVFSIWLWKGMDW